MNRNIEIKWKLTTVGNTLVQVVKVVPVLWENLEGLDLLVCLDLSVTLDPPASLDPLESKVCSPMKHIAVLCFRS